MRANGACPIRRHESIPADAPQAAADAPPCSWHHASDDGVITIWPEQYRAWAADAGVRSPLDRRAEAQAYRSGAVGPRRIALTAAALWLRVTSPAEGTVFLIDPTLRPEFQAVPLRAIGSGVGRLAWTVDGRDAGAASAGSTVHWPLTRGEHHAVVRDALGRSAEVGFVVK
jgi:hypothetical protein